LEAQRLRQVIESAFVRHGAALLAVFANSCEWFFARSRSPEKQPIDWHLPPEHAVDPKE
jgi:hypothetical protein